MSELFGGDAFRDCVMSSDRLYRYRWSAGWKREPKTRLLFVMLNPSTADENTLDATVKKTIRLTKRWGYDALDIANVFAYRSTDPRELYKTPDPIGPENDKHIHALARGSSMIIVAWGKHANRVGLRGDAVGKLLAEFSLSALRINGDGSPEHPLYVPENIQPQPWKPA